MVQGCPEGQDLETEPFHGQGESQPEVHVMYSLAGRIWFAEETALREVAVQGGMRVESQSADWERGPGIQEQGRLRPTDQPAAWQGPVSSQHPSRLVLESGLWTGTEKHKHSPTGTWPQSK